MATTHLLTAEDLLEMPDDGHRYELIRGELREMPPAGYVHGEIALSIGAELRQYVKQNRLGKTYAAETGFIVATKIPIMFLLPTPHSLDWDEQKVQENRPASGPALLISRSRLFRRGTRTATWPKRRSTGSRRGLGWCWS